MRKFIVATRNKGKLEEIKEILKDFNFNVISMDQAGIGKEIEETGNSFEENALIKAREIFKLTNEMVMADDSGLEVDYLGGAPGIYTSRFAGEGATDLERINKLLNLLEGVPWEKRTARFVCAIAVCFPDGSNLTVKGICDGYIGFELRGSNGFGYDPIFYLHENGVSMAELEPEHKHKISHRGKALAELVKKLRER
ncbi:MAG TPA: XTP/dITP diphosphatase [Clostridiaceae bacterium]|jgi:XTP/dITP diphosphohydrolase|nr:XTP/dITP diphosphatase [Clostridiaceae bacterium]